MKKHIQNTKTEIGGLMTGVCLGVALIIGGIPAILNMRHSCGITFEDREVGAHFIGSRHKGGVHEVL
jgi:hypothetical protein